MRKLLLVLAAALPLSVFAQTVNLGGTDYEVTTISDREIGPGIRHTRFRLPAYPLNINVLRVDLNNPYNRIETTVANESAKGTESLVKAAQRQSYPGHRALGGANANFWVVSSQPEAAVYSGTTRNASIRNGAIVTESNQHRDQWDGGTMRTGVVSVSTDRVLSIDYCTSYIWATSEKFGTLNVHQSNKGVHDNELCMYNSFYGPDRAFQPLVVNGGKYALADEGDATEVILDFADGQKWQSNTDITFIVKEVRLNKGKGTLGNHDLALVGRGDNAAQLAKLAQGDAVTIQYGWIYNPGADNESKPQVEQAVGGNALVMRAGELTEHNENEAYNSQVYSRTGYGCSQDGKMLYIIVIDKSTDPDYGQSAGCNTAKMCEFARYLGCWNMANFDAGGSAEMFVEDRIENTTTEGTPRAVANGWLIYSTAPEDADDYNTLARLEFDDYSLVSPIYASYTPKVIAYNRYGAVIDPDFRDFTLSCPEELGSCQGTTFTASGVASTGQLTATSGSVSVSKTMSVVNAQMSLRLHSILIDANRLYPMEVSSTIGQTVYSYNPAAFQWSTDDPEVAAVENGTLRGYKEGTTAISCQLGEFEDHGTVTVQIAQTPTIGVTDWSEWRTKYASGITDVSLSNDGTISYNYKVPRDPSVGVSGEYALYSLPDAVKLEFSSSIPVKSITVEVRLGQNTKSSRITIKPEEGFAAQTSHSITLPMEEVADMADLATFPITIRAINFKTDRSDAYKGAQSLHIEGLYGTYPDYSGMQQTEVAARQLALTPNPVVAGGCLRIACPGMAAVEIFSASGMRLADTRLDGADSAVIAAPATAGVYIVRVTTTNGGIVAEPIIVR